MFHWDESKFGTRPVEGQNGLFEGRETQLAPCDCPANMAKFVDNGEVCYWQSAALHAEFGGYETVEAMLAEMESAEAQVLEAVGDLLVEAMIVSALEAALSEGLPEGMSVRLVTADELMALGFNPAEFAPVELSDDTEPDFSGLDNLFNGEPDQPAVNNESDDLPDWLTRVDFSIDPYVGGEGEGEDEEE